MKIFLQILLFLFFYQISTVFAQENRELDAIDILQENTNALLAIVSSENYHNKSKHQAMKNQAENLIMQLFSFEDFTMLAVGKKWNTFSKEEQDCLTLACTKLLRNTYVDYLDDYDNQSIEYISSTKANNGTRAQIDAIACTEQKEIPLSFRMLIKENGEWQVYDVLIEGISLVKNYRTQFTELLLTKSPSEVAQIIEEKNNALLAEKQRAK